MSTPPDQAGTPAPASAFRHAVWPVLAALGALYALLAAGRISNSDATSMLEVSRALLRGGINVPEEVWSVPGRGGLFYSQYGLLTPVWWTPWVLAGQVLARLVPMLPAPQWEEFMVSFAAIPPTLAVLALLAWSWWRAGLAAARVRAGLWLFGLASLLLPYAKIPGSDLLMALGLFGAWVALSGRACMRNWLLAGLGLGAALLARKQAQIEAPFFLLFAAWVWWTRGRGTPQRWRLPAALATGLGACVLLALAYNFARYGHPLLEKYRGHGPFVLPTLGQWLEWSWSFTAGGRVGFVLYAAVPLVVAAMALRPWWRREPATVALVAALVAANLAFFSVQWYWAGGVGFGSRFLVFLTPLLAVGWAHVDFPLSGLRRAILGAAIVLALFLNGPGVLVDPLAVTARNELLRDGRGWEPMVRLAEAGRVLGVPAAQLPESAVGHPVLGHRPFAVPDFWWAQVGDQLRKRSAAP
ncbi:MAG: hypothetical protein ACKVYV_07910 [Limisphaerales bacterium]